MKKLYVKTYGCQMNVYDSDKIEDVLVALGYNPVDDVAGADMVVLNTCHIREKAAEKVYSELGRIRKERQRMSEEEGRHMLIAVAGCVAQAEGEEIFRRAPFVDIVVGPQAYHRLPELVKNAENANSKVIDLEFPTKEKFDFLTGASNPKGPSAFLTIQEGCDKFCTFCVVPYTRGAEVSRAVPEITREAISLVEQGAKEITLLGQNVNAYHGKAIDGEVWGLARLIRHLANIKGLESIRYTTSHPRDMEDDLIAAHGDVAKLMPFLHLPIQSGSDAILKKMNRKHTAQDYLLIVEKLRTARPDIQLSSDFIVGFPGETEQDFADTMELVEQVKFAQAYSFKYSARPGTPAATKEDQVPEEVKVERLARLQALLNTQQEAYNIASIGQIMPVLLDRKGKFAGQLVGRSPYMQSVRIDGDEALLGQIIDVEITEGYANSLKGIVAGGYQSKVAVG